MKKRNCGLRINKFDATQRKKMITADHYFNLYDDYLENQKCISLRYRQHLCRIATLFVYACFGKKSIDLKLIKPKHLKEFIYEYASSVSPATVRNVSYALRSFLRFLKLKNLINNDFSAAIPPIASWKGDQIPSYLTSKEVLDVLHHCDKTTSAGLIEYTIIRLILSLGLRASEVAKLTLDDFDWIKGEIFIKGKNSANSRLPLTQELGNDLVVYLRKGRPSTSSRFFFVSFQPPYNGLKSISVTRIVGKVFKRAGLNKKGKAHLLRHTFATRLLGNGASLEEIRRLLRHKSIDTTAIYAKVDFNRLRSITLPWPGNLNFGDVS